MAIDMSGAVKAPPRRITGSPTSAKPSAKTSSGVDTRSQKEKRLEGLQGFGQLGQGLCMMTQQWSDAAAIGQHWGPIALELSNIAETNKYVASGVDFLIEVGPYGALITAVMPLALQLMANHKMVDATRMGSLGVVPPEVLEAQMKAQVLRMQAEAMKAQQMALDEARKAQAEYEASLRQNGATE